MRRCGALETGGWSLDASHGAQKGVEVIINTLQLPAGGEMGGVGEFGLAIMERILQ